MCTQIWWPRPVSRRFACICAMLLSLGLLFGLVPCRSNCQLGLDGGGSLVGNVLHQPPDVPVAIVSL